MGRVGGEGFSRCPLRRICSRASVGDDVPYTVKSDLLLESCVYGFLPVFQFFLSWFLFFLHRIAEKKLQFINVLDMRYLAALHERDPSCLLRYDDDFGVAHLRDADGGLVAHSIACRYVGPLCYRKGASGRQDPVACDHHRSVVERGVLEEYVHDQTSVDAGVDAVSRVYDLVKRHSLGEDDEGSGLVLRHSPAGLGQVVHRVAVRDVRRVLSEYPVDDGPSLGVVHVPVAEAYQEFPDLRLEYHDEGEHTDVKHGLHEGGHEPHVECRDQHPDEVERHDGHKDAHGRRSP